MCPVRFTLELDKDNPSRLLLGFSAPVNPTIATEPGRVRLTFRREPIVAPSTEAIPYTDPLITGVAFSEHDGLAEIDMTGTAPLMANFADGGKTIIVTGAPAPPPPPQPPPPTPVPATTQAQTPQPRQPAAPRFLVLIDPAHGGNDIGAAITPSLPEKDVVLALARRVQHELQSRGIAAGLLRTSDVAITLDQRATIGECGASGALHLSARRQYRTGRPRVHRDAACGELVTAGISAVGHSAGRVPRPEWLGGRLGRRGT